MANILGLASLTYAIIFWLITLVIASRGEQLLAWFSMTGFISTALSIGWLVYG